MQSIELEVVPKALRNFVMVGYRVKVNYKKKTDMFDDQDCWSKSVKYSIFMDKISQYLEAYAVEIYPIVLYPPKFPKAMIVSCILKNSHLKHLYLFYQKVLRKLPSHKPGITQKQRRVYIPRNNCHPLGSSCQWTKFFS